MLQILQVFQVADCSNCNLPILGRVALQVYTDVSERLPVPGVLIAAPYVRSERTLVWGKLRR